MQNVEAVTWPRYLGSLLQSTYVKIEILYALVLPWGLVKVDLMKSGRTY